MRIITEQAPSAKPVSVSARLTTDWQTIIEVPEYDIPVVGFGTSRRIAPGVAEISSSMLASNTSLQSTGLFIRIIRAIRPLELSQTQDEFSVFDGGQGHSASDELTLINGAEIIIDQVDVNGAVTEFTLLTVGNFTLAGETLIQVASSGSGVNFSFTVNESNLSTTVGFFTVAENTPVEPRDVLVFPLNGQFLLTGDKLQVKAADDDQLEITLSYTEGQAEEDDIPGEI
jgi:hypothetical protein